MHLPFLFFLNSAALGVGLAMDAFSVSLTNGLREPQMKRARMSAIAGVYAFFQFAMPMVGWVCIHTIAVQITAFQKFVPWIALGLLLFIGGQMVVESIRTRRSADPEAAPVDPALYTVNHTAIRAENVRILPVGTLLLQGVATSIDALSVGFTISEYGISEALLASLIIAILTFFICLGGLVIGKKVGNRLESKATLVGGILLILIGLEIGLKGILA